MWVEFYPVTQREQGTEALNSKLRAFEIGIQLLFRRGEEGGEEEACGSQKMEGDILSPGA